MTSLTPDLEQLDTDDTPARRFAHIPSVDSRDVALCGTRMTGSRRLDYEPAPMERCVVCEDLFDQLPPTVKAMIRTRHG